MANKSKGKASKVWKSTVTDPLKSFGNKLDEYSSQNLNLGGEKKAFNVNIVASNVKGIGSNNSTEETKEDQKQKTRAEKIADKISSKYAKEWGVFIDKSISSLTKAIENQFKNLDKDINTYLSAQTAANAHLAGTSQSLSTLSSTLSSVYGKNTTVKMESVFSEMTEFINAGISSNVTTKAYLATIAKNMNAHTSSTNDSINRLVRLGQASAYENRLALEYGMQKFLNQNYQNSQYVVQALQKVSDGLVDMMSMTSSSNGMAVESRLQAWLGSLYSNGMSDNSISSLTSAFNALGSGDISNIGSGISNLLLMGAARAGLDYGSLLTGGITGKDTDAIMSGVVSYLSEINSSGNNVIKSQLSQIFGVNVGDLLAASKTGNISGGPSRDINNMISDYTGFVPVNTQLDNIMSNFMWNWGQGIAGDQSKYRDYLVTKLIQNSGIGDVIGSLPIPVLGKLAGGIFNNLNPLASALMYSTQGGIWDNITNPSVFVSSLGTLINDIYDAFSTAGKLVLKGSGAGVSSSVYVSSGPSTSLSSGSGGGLLSGLNSTLGNVAEGISIAGTAPATEDIINTISDNVLNIYTILDNYMEEISSNVRSIAEDSSYSSTGGLRR